MWLKRQVDDSVGEQIAALDIKGIHQRQEYKRQYPEGEAAAHVVGFTNVEDKGQEGIELAFHKDLAGRDGSRHVIKDRLGRVVEDVGESVRARRRPGHRPVDRLQGAVLRLPEASATRSSRTRPRPAACVVLDAQTGEVLALANYPSYDPATARNLTGEQLRNRALTDTFEPGSTMKPFIVGCGAARRAASRRTTVIDDRAGPASRSPARPSRRPHRTAC